MYGFRNSVHRERLFHRRDILELTLRYLESERRNVAANKSRMDPKACENRLRLLDHLARWYREEMGEIDHAISGEPPAPGRCASCREPVETDWPESPRLFELCGECREYRDVLGRERRLSA